MFSRCNRFSSCFDRFRSRSSAIPLSPLLVHLRLEVIYLHLVLFSQLQPAAQSLHEIFSDPAPTSQTPHCIHIFAFPRCPLLCPIFLFSVDVAVAYDISSSRDDNTFRTVKMCSSVSQIEASLALTLVNYSCPRVIPPLALDDLKLSCMRSVFAARF